MSIYFEFVLNITKQQYQSFKDFENFKILILIMLIIYYI